MRTAILALIAALALAVAGVVANIIIIGQSAVAAPATVGSGDLLWQSGTFTVRLTGEPCPIPELVEQLESEGVPPARKYIATQPGRVSGGCWAKDMAGDVIARDLAGLMGDLPIPLEWFRQDSGV